MSSKSETPVEEERHILSPHASERRKAIVLIVVCLAQFIDSFNTGGMIICLNSISEDFSQNAAITQWVLTAFNLTFGSFLLLSGRLTDIYHPKPVFIAGFFIVGVFGIGAGFVQNIIGLIVIRAVQGIGAALTIPSAISMLTSAYTEPAARGVALTFFSSAGTLGLCLGFVIGGVIVDRASWRWVFWVIACVAVPLSIASIKIIPVDSYKMGGKEKKMDIVGVALMTVAIILLIFSLSEAPTAGWGTAMVLAPLIISIFMMAAFFWWQTRLPEDQALIPPHFWFIPNFAVLIAVAFCNWIYYTGPVVLYSEYFPAAYKWSPLSVGLHFLPIGVTSGIICIIFPRQVLRLPPKAVLVGGQAFAGLFSILYVFGDTKEKFWAYTFVAEILVTAGSSVAYLVSNVGLITSVPKDKVGVGAAIFNASNQVGVAVNVAVVTTILSQIQTKNPSPSYAGPAASLWWVVAVGCFEALLSLALFRPKKSSLVSNSELELSKEKSEAV